MKPNNVLYRDDTHLYYLNEENDLVSKSYSSETFREYKDVMYLRDAKPLFTFRDKLIDIEFVVYFVHKRHFIGCCSGIYSIFLVSDNYIKDYTISNLDLL